MVGLPTSSRDRSADAASPVHAARSLVPALAEASSTIEEQRRVPDEIVKLLRDAGMFHVAFPGDVGGGDYDPVTAAQVVEELATGDASAAWCVMLAAQMGGFVGFFPEDEAKIVFGDGQIAASSARPIGRALAKDGGYTVSGRWPFASGSSHADWFGAECIIYDGDEPRKDAAGNNVTRMLMVPRADVVLHDTWFTTGLRGTASNDFSVESTFVPHARGLQMLVDPPLVDRPIHRAMSLVFINHASHSFGIARASIEVATELIRTKRGWGDKPLRENARLQACLAESIIAVESARSHLYAKSAELWMEALDGRDDNAALRSHVRLAASHGARASLHAVDVLHGILGTSSIFAGSPLERHFRDIRTASTHVMIGQLTIEAAGRVELGMEPEMPFF